jgi:uncharacterized protein
MKHLTRVFARWGLTLHIYVSMAGFILVLFFAITGLTLNHEDFGRSGPRVTTSTIAVPSSLLNGGDERAITRHLQSVVAMSSPITNYRADPDQIDVTFTAPGKRTRIVINRATGSAEVEAETRGWLGQLGDLHKGLDSGSAWKWVIDLTAVLLTISSLTGIVTLLGLPKRRVVGLLAGVVSLVILAILFLVWVPR